MIGSSSQQGDWPCMNVRRVSARRASRSGAARSKEGGSGMGLGGHEFGGYEFAGHELGGHGQVWHRAPLDRTPRHRTSSCRAAVLVRAMSRSVVWGRVGFRLASCRGSFSGRSSARFAPGWSRHSSSGSSRSSHTFSSGLRCRRPRGRPVEWRGEWGGEWRGKWRSSWRGERRINRWRRGAGVSPRRDLPA